MAVLSPPATRITKRHKHAWLIPVGEVPRIMGLVGTAQCSKCRMRVRFDHAAELGDA